MSEPESTDARQQDLNLPPRRSSGGEGAVLESLYNSLRERYAAAMHKSKTAQDMERVSHLSEACAYADAAALVWEGINSLGATVPPDEGR